jgi:hypothetical protein
MMNNFSIKEINEMKNNLIWSKSEQIESPGCIYFLRYCELPYIKIGYSSKPTPDERMKSYTAPKGVEKVGYFTITNAKKIEKEIHESLAEHRVDGEWFDITKEKVDEIIEKYNAHHRNNIQKALILMQMHDVDELIKIARANERPPVQIAEKETIKDMFIKYNPTNEFTHKKDFLIHYKKRLNKSVAQTYIHFKEEVHLFEEKKDGRIVNIRLRELE